MLRRLANSTKFTYRVLRLPAPNINPWPLAMSGNSPHCYLRLSMSDNHVEQTGFFSLFTTLPNLSRQESHTSAAAPPTQTTLDVKSDQSDDEKEQPDERGRYVDEGDGVEYLNGEPIISTGSDVSRFVVDVRDDGDDPMTIRSLFLGTIWAGLAAALYQVRCLDWGRRFSLLTSLPMQIYVFKPVQMHVSSVFLLLIVYTSGQLWATLLPRQSWVEGTRWERYGWIIQLINPGKFTIKEVS